MRQQQRIVVKRLNRETGDHLFQDLADVPLRDLAKLNQACFALTTLLPTKASALSTNVIKDVWLIREPRLLVITIHLYFEYILGKLMERKKLRANQRELSFSQKLRIVKEFQLLAPPLVESLRVVNQLRNNYAHEIFFDIFTWDPLQIPYMAGYSGRVPRQRQLLSNFNVIVLRLTFMALLLDITTVHRWIHLENVPRAFRKRSEPDHTYTEYEHGA
jgi:hypothetical protein